MCTRAGIPTTVVTTSWSTQEIKKNPDRPTAAHHSLHLHVHKRCTPLHSQIYRNFFPCWKWSLLWMVLEGGRTMAHGQQLYTCLQISQQEGVHNLFVSANLWLILTNKGGWPPKKMMTYHAWFGNTHSNCTICGCQTSPTNFLQNSVLLAAAEGMWGALSEADWTPYWWRALCLAHPNR